MEKIVQTAGKMQLSMWDARKGIIFQEVLHYEKI